MCEGAFVYMVWYICVPVCICMLVHVWVCACVGDASVYFGCLFLKNCPPEVLIPLSHSRQVEILWDEPLGQPGRWMHRGFVESLFWLLKQSGVGLRTQGPVLTSRLEHNSTGRLERLSARAEASRGGWGSSLVGETSLEDILPEENTTNPHIKWKVPKEKINSE